MKDYARSMEKIMEIRKDIDCHDPLMKLGVEVVQEDEIETWLGRALMVCRNYKCISDVSRFVVL